MNLHKLLIFFILLNFPFISSANFSNDKLQTIDRVYEDNIKSVLLYPNNGEAKDVIQPAIISINDHRKLMLSFDDLSLDIQNYYVQILNCNADWSVSNLNSILYLTDYNEFQIFDRQNSFNTRIPYVHYKFELPRTKTSGNFLVIVYRDGNEENLILSKRFMVYENEVAVTPNVKFAQSGLERNTSQRVDFTLQYNPSIQNPMERMNVVVRQNYHWNESLVGIKPQFMQENIQTYDYTYFGQENLFNGLNEFRFFDLRSLRSNGMNVSKIILHTDKSQVLLTFDKTRNGLTFGSSFDINGYYVPEQYETKTFEIEPDYAEVTFTLEEDPTTIKGRVFIIGALTDWALNSNFEMKWDEEYKLYSCTALLKQGYYNYSYALLKDDNQTIDYTYFEGNHSQTQNIYDIIVYYRGPGGMFDRVVGYKSANFLEIR